MNSPESSEVFKDYDTLRCDECQGIMKVPKTDLTYRCPHCGCKYKFEMVEEDEVS